MNHSDECSVSHAGRTKPATLATGLRIPDSSKRVVTSNPSYSADVAFPTNVRPTSRILVKIIGQESRRSLSSLPLAGLSPKPGSLQGPPQRCKCLGDADTLLATPAGTVASQLQAYRKADAPLIRQLAVTRRQILDSGRSRPHLVSSSTLLAPNPSSNAITT